jgi:hypothetical protein
MIRHILLKSQTNKYVNNVRKKQKKTYQIQTFFLVITIQEMSLRNFFVCYTVFDTKKTLSLKPYDKTL